MTINKTKEKLRSNKIFKGKIVIDKTKEEHIDYNQYTWNLIELLKYIGIASLALFLIGYLFYRSFIIAFIVALFGIKYPSIKVKDLIKKQKNDLNIQFNDAIISMSTSLSAGSSVEMSIKNALKDLKIFYPDDDAYIVKEFKYIQSQIDMNINLEVAFEDFSERAGTEEIKDFVDVFKICKRTGGNLVQVIKNTTNVLRDKLEVKEEIEVLVTGVQFEQKIIMLMPLIVVVMSSDYLDPIMQGKNRMIGYPIMTVVLVVFYVAYMISKKITDIKV